jgi:hypothetical protein
LTFNTKGGIIIKDPQSPSLHIVLFFLAHLFVLPS